MVGTRQKTINSNKNFKLSKFFKGKTSTDEKELIINLVTHKAGVENQLARKENRKGPA
jgi:hypothetical protein